MDTAIFFCLVSIHIPIHYKISVTMEITINGNTYTPKYSFRSMLIFEQIMGKSFNPTTLNDVVVFFYSCLLANKAEVIYDDFLDAVDEDPSVINDFTNWMMELADINTIKGKKKTTKKGKKEQETMTNPS